MNNLASYNWLKEFVKTDLTPDAFAREISLRSMSVEKIDDVAARLDKCVVGLVNELRVHPNADRLRIVTVNIGSETVEVVCGGTNVLEGMKVAVALPGARVRWHGEGDLITLAETEIRGVKSIGMICAPSELGFPELETGDHQIWDLSQVTQAAAGTSLSEALGLDDVMFDIEITTNRPDAMGVVGLAREAGAAVGAEFSWTAPALPPGQSEIPFSVSIDDRSRCFRQMAVVIDNVQVAPSPWWLQKRLLMAGVRPINNIVDITNYVLLEYAQPLHAFDYRALEGGEIRVRAAKAGEKITLLNGKEYELDGELVLADSAKPLDVAGIMGGEFTGTTSATKTIVLSASAFDATSIRRTSRKLNLQSDAQLLFEKGLSTEALPSALARAVELVQQVAGGQVASMVCDVRTGEYQPLQFSLRPDKVRERIGVEIDDTRIENILLTLGFAVETASGDVSWKVNVPYWRDHDIEGEVDLVEEVARIYGYHEMPSVLPSGALPTTAEPFAVTWERFTKRFLAAAGYDEFFGYSFANADDLRKYGQDPAQAYALLNTLTSDQSHLRTSLMPSVLRAIESNQGHTPSGAFFELSRIYLKRQGDIPEENYHLVFGEFGYDDVEATFRRVRGTLEQFAAKTGLSIRLSREAIGEHWHPTRSATIFVNDKALGMIGEVAENIQSAFGVDRRVFVVLLELEELFGEMHLTHRYVPVSEFPSITRDLSVAVDEQVAFADLAEAAKGEMVTSVGLVDVYRGTGVAEGKKSVTLSLTMSVPDRTLTSEEAQAVLDRTSSVLAERFGGILRS